ncbi:hypothetical protein LXL04_012509 [Taraxacum kok-saghyz]
MLQCQTQPATVHRTLQYQNDVVLDFATVPLQYRVWPSCYSAESRRVATVSDRYSVGAAWASGGLRLKNLNQNTTWTGMGIDFEDDESDYGSEIAIWDLDRDVKLSSGRRCKVAAASDNVVLTAEMNDSNGGVGFSTCDSRVEGRQ